MDETKITEIVQTTAKVTVQEALTQRGKILNDEFDARYHDVGLLLRNYRRLKLHCLNTSPDVLAVSSICALRYKTDLMMSYVDKMLAAYKAICFKSNDSDEIRRWNVIYLRFISRKKASVDDIAGQLGIDRRTFYRDIDRAKEDLAVLLFGLEAVGSWKHKR